MSDWSNLVKSMSNMYISQHSEFILTPLIKILIDGVSACHAIGDGMDSYPMGEYLMQSLFLKMTGGARTEDEMYLLGFSNNGLRVSL